MNAYSHLPKRTSAQYATVPTREQDAAEEPEPKSPGWWQRIICDSWIPEILALSCSAACLVAIAIVLFMYNGETTPQMRYGITLNAIIAILATASRSSLIFTVASAIGQLKWCWFAPRRRKLYDMQVFDDASRGPWGSFSLLFGLGLRPLAAIGAMVTILALAFDPFVQQILSYPTRSAVSRTASASILRAGIFAEEGDSEDLRLAAHAGFWSGADRFAQRPHCPTGTCTWPAYSTVGWCAKCTDALSYTRVSNCSLGDKFDWFKFTRAWFQNHTDGCQLDFGHGDTHRFFKFGGDPRYPNDPAAVFVTEAVWPLGGIEMDDLNLYLSNKTYVGVENPVVALGHYKSRPCNETDTDQRLVRGWCLDSAQECVLSMCETTMSSSVTNGTATLEVADTNFGYMGTQWGLDEGLDEYLAKFCWHANEPKSLRNVETSSSAQIFCPSHDFSPYQRSLADSLTGEQTIFVQESASGPLTWSSPETEYISKIGLEQALQGVAASISALALRPNGTTSNYTHFPPTAVNGTAYGLEGFVHVSWPWLALPFALVLATVILLLIAAIQSRRCKLRLWKSSILPLIYHGLEPGPGFGSDRNGFKGVSEIAEYAASLDVQLTDRPRKDLATLVRSRK